MREGTRAIIDHASNIARRWRDGNDSQRAAILQELLDRGSSADFLLGIAVGDRLDRGMRGDFVEALELSVHVEGIPTRGRLRR
jgi:hypothetical protein